MKSMTGYGKSIIQINNIDISIEIRSVNNRFLDIALRMPKELNDYEYEIRKNIKKKLNRGKINVYINLIEATNVSAELMIDMEKVKQRYDLLNYIHKKLNLSGSITMDNLMEFGDLFDPGLQSIESKKIKKYLLKGINDALKQFEDMRKAEGNNLSADMKNRIDQISEWTEFVGEKGRDNIQKEFERLQNNIFLLIDSNKIEKNRLEAELAIISDKVDVTEECVRMASHIKLFNDTLNNNGEAGKKLTFILQEMLREANTMNSKTTDTNIAHTVIRIKEEIEKLREQSQNIE